MPATTPWLWQSKWQSTHLLGVKLLTFKYGKNLETLLQQGNVQLKYNSLIIYCCFQFSQFSPAQSLSCVRLFVTPWIAAHKASRSITNSRSSLKLMSIESVMPSSHLTLCCPLLLLPPIPPRIRVFSSESTLHMRWPKYWSFSFSVSPSNENLDWSPLEWTGWISLQSKGLWRVFSNTTVQKHWKNHSLTHELQWEHTSGLLWNY